MKKLAVLFALYASPAMAQDQGLHFNAIEYWPSSRGAYATLSVQTPRGLLQNVHPIRCDRFETEGADKISREITEFYNHFAASPAFAYWQLNSEAVNKTIPAAVEQAKTACLAPTS